MAMGRAGGTGHGAEHDSGGTSSSGAGSTGSESSSSGRSSITGSISGSLGDSDKTKSESPGDYDARGNYIGDSKKPSTSTPSDTSFEGVLDLSGLSTLSVEEAEKNLSEAKDKARNSDVWGAAIGGLFGLVTGGLLSGLSLAQTGAKVGDFIDQKLRSITGDFSVQNLKDKLGITNEEAEKASMQLSNMPAEDRNSFFNSAVSGMSGGEFKGTPVETPVSPVQDQEPEQVVTGRPLWDNLVNEFYGTGTFNTPEQYKDLGYYGQVAKQLNESGQQDTEGHTGDWTAEEAKNQIENVHGLSASDHFDQFGKARGLGQPITGARQLYEDQATHAKDAAEQFNTGLTGATDKQSDLLNSLMTGSQEGTGMFKPFQFTVGGQQMSFVPRAQREQADQLSKFGQTELENRSQTLKDILGTAGMTDPSASGLNYLSGLMKMAGSEEDRTKTDLEKLRILSGQELGEKQLEANEPSVLQKLGELVNVGKGAYDLGTDIFG